MRFFIVFQMFMAFLLIPVTGSFADDNIWGTSGKYIWGPPHADFVRPYLRTAKIPHNSQWADDSWSPQDWVEGHGSVQAVIDRFYSAGFITDQYSEDNIPVLEVGQRFLDLSPQDKRRVVAFVDEAYGVTQGHDKAVMLIYFYNDDKPVGIFNAAGLQLQ